MNQHLDFIIKYESGELNDDEIIEGFQKLLDDGILFQLQGSYGRTGMMLLREGLIHLPKDKDVYDAYGNIIKGE